MNLKEKLLRKGDFVWELPAGSAEDQKIPIVLYISDDLFEFLEEEALRQAVNAATLKGVEKAIYIMPDVHVGYGFPVGGVMATNVEEGIISPGSVGYDINCLPTGTQVLSELGYSFKIENFKGERVVGISKNGKKVMTPVLFFTRREKLLIKIKTSLGYTLRASADHPILTPYGMKEISKLRIGDRVAVYPFKGIAYEKPPKLGIKLHIQDFELPYLLKLAGFLLVRGNLHKEIVEFNGTSEEISEVITDLTRLGYKYTLGKQLHIETPLLAHQLKNLGIDPNAPSVPNWLFRLPLWLKRLFLSAVFGGSPQFLSVESDSYSFLVSLGNLLREFNIAFSLKRREISIVEEKNNILRFFEKIFFEYSPHKRRKASLIISQIKGLNSALAMAVGAEISERSLSSGEIIWDSIESITEEPYGGQVYDFTLKEREHNFIADGFVVSNCGVRLVATNLERKEVEPRIRDLMKSILQKIPAGVGSRGEIRLSKSSMRDLLSKGAKWAVEQGYGSERDLHYIESYGSLPSADPDKVSDEAYERGSDELGTVGSGNHFVEIQTVEEIYDEKTALSMGIRENQILYTVHSGSRGLGHQICTDYLKIALKSVEKYAIKLPDPQLACMPFSSEEGQSYFKAMCAAANYAFANRQILGFKVALILSEFFAIEWEDLGYRLIYDHAHNIAKVEEHRANGVKKLIVHRKGATRAFPPFDPEVPPAYREIGQPVIIPGDMGRASYLLVGQPSAMELSFGTACHGAGRLMSRRQAKKLVKEKGLEKVIGDLVVVAHGKGTIMEEIPQAYKDVSEVVRVIHETGIAKMVAKLKPLGTLKG